MQFCRRFNFIRDYSVKITVGCTLIVYLFFFFYFSYIQEITYRKIFRVGDTEIVQENQLPVHFFFQALFIFAMTYKLILIKRKCSLVYFNRKWSILRTNLINLQLVYEFCVGIGLEWHHSSLVWSFECVELYPTKTRNFRLKSTRPELDRQIDLLPTLCELKKFFDNPQFPPNPKYFNPWYIY